MFYWMKRSRGGAEALDNMSKAEILRGIVTEKLSTAAQEILAVVERTVAGYEEEAAGFRREIDRQRKQLELLLQPRVALERKALIPEEGGQEVVVLSEEEQEQEEEQEEEEQEEEEEEEEDRQPAGVKESGGLGFLWFDEDEGGDEDELSGSRRRREDLKDPDFQVTSRFPSPRARSDRRRPDRRRPDRRRPGRPRSSDTRSHLDLRVCVLQDPCTEVLSNTVFRKFPVKELRCPRGLPEADFLDLLRSTFPQLAAEKPFEVFTSDRTKRLQPLSVSALTPEEICSSIRLSGAVNSALYIRLKPEASGAEDQDPQKHDQAPNEVPRSSSPRAESEKRRRGRPRLGQEPPHHLLRVCLLQDGEPEGGGGSAPSAPELTKSSVKDLRCPRGVQEADFLALLRAAFPQLEGDGRRLDVFRSDRSRRLQRLQAAPLTPEEILRSAKTAGISRTLLYIRPRQEAEEEEETTDGALTSEDAGLTLSAPPPADGTEEADDGDPAERAACSSEEGDADWKPMARRGGALVRLSGGSKMPCKVCGAWYRIQGSLIKHAWSHADEPPGACGVCGEHFQSADALKAHLKTYQKTHDCSYCAKSFLTVTGLKHHTTLHTGDRPFRCDVCGKTFAHASSLSVHRWVHVEDKPYRCERCPKAFGLMAQLRAHGRTHAGRDKFLCNVCGKTVHDLRSLTRHKATHSGERRFSCELCGKRFKLLNTLKSHEKTHTVRERPFLCHVCCKTFMSNNGLQAHIRTHSGERPFPCAVCGKGFISNGELKAHLRVHTGEAPYGCSQCGRFFKRKTHLNNHVRSHLGIKLFVCTVCGKACSRQEHLTVHMRTHNGERPYQCAFCDKAFTQGHCLKTHVKSHHGEQAALREQPEPAGVQRAKVPN